MNSRHSLHILCSVLLLCLLAVFTPPGAHGEEITEERLKAIFLVNVLGYVDWPGKSKPATYTVCMASSEEMASELRSYARSKGLDARVRVRDLEGTRSVEGCDALFIENDIVRGEAYLLKEAAEKRVLTIGGGERFMDRGGMVRIYLKEKKLAFDINTKAADASRIKINARLLPLAKKVY